MKLKAFILACLLSVTVTGYSQISGTNPQLSFRETDQTLPAGLWRVRVQGDAFLIERNTAAGNDFSTTNVPLSITSTAVNLGLIPLRAGDGTQASPSISFNGEPSSGFYRGTQEIKVSVFNTAVASFVGGGINLTSGKSILAGGTQIVSFYSGIDGGSVFRTNAGHYNFKLIDAASSGDTLRIVIQTAGGGVAIDSTDAVESVFSHLYLQGSDVNFTAAGAPTAVVNTAGFGLTYTGSVSWNGDTYLYRDAANALALKNGAAQQVFRIYGTTTGPKYLALGHDGSNPYIISFDDTTLLLGTNNQTRWAISNAAGSYAFYPNTDNAYNIGGGGNRIASGYFGTSISVGANVSTGGSVRLANGDVIAARNNANSANVTLVYASSSNQAVLGGSDSSDTVIETGSGRGIYLNGSAIDVDIIFRSDTNNNHYISDAGAFSGVGAHSFGAAATATAYINEDAPNLTSAGGIAFYRHLINSNGGIAIGTGTSGVVATLAVVEPNIILSGNTVSDAYTVYIANAPTEGTRNGALWVGGGNVRLQGSTAIGPSITGNPSYPLHVIGGGGTAASNAITAMFDPASGNGVVIGASGNAGQEGWIQGHTGSATNLLRIQPLGGVLMIGNISATSQIRTSLGTPATLVDGDWWVECSGTTPTRTCSIRVRDTGSTRTIATTVAF